MSEPSGAKFLRGFIQLTQLGEGFHLSSAANLCELGDICV
jgi:hypothetical protein